MTKIWLNDSFSFLPTFSFCLKVAVFIREGNKFRWLKSFTSRASASSVLNAVTWSPRGLQCEPFFCFFWRAQIFQICQQFVFTTFFHVVLIMHQSLQLFSLSTAGTRGAKFKLISFAQLLRFATDTLKVRPLNIKTTWLCSLAPRKQVHLATSKYKFCLSFLQFTLQKTICFPHSYRFRNIIVTANGLFTVSKKCLVSVYRVCFHWTENIFVSSESE